VNEKSRIVTFRAYTKYRKASSFIPEGIELLLKQEEEQPSGWSVAGREGDDGAYSPAGRSRSSANFAGRRRLGASSSDLQHPAV
jgi:hypothetical protein